MKKVVLLLVCGMVVSLSANAALAIPAFKKEFDARYVDSEPQTPEKEALGAAVKKAKCNVCHGKDENGKDSKKVRNAYGEALSELLDKKEDAKNKEKINEALDKVAEMKSDPDDDNSPTFGDLIKEGKLPAGDEN